MYWYTRIGDTEQGGKRKMAKIASELKSINKGKWLEEKNCL